MTTNSNQTSDLVLRLVGGTKNGQLFPVSTKKCLITQPVAGAQGSVPECAIFRGTNGTAIRSYMGQMTVNGNEAEVHWLQKGDEVKLDSSCFVVETLGFIEGALSPNDLSTFDEQVEKL